jgi:hypothetical protein
VADAVPRNRSPLRNSRLLGNLTGKFAILGVLGLTPGRNSTIYQPVVGQFPKNANREFPLSKPGISVCQKGKSRLIVETRFLA